MNCRDDFYSKEATLINRSKRELANGLEKDPVYKLRLQCFCLGATGVLRLARAFCNMDQDGSKYLNLNAFKNAIHRTVTDCNENDIIKMFDLFDSERKGYVNIDEFLSKIRPPMSQCRRNLIDKAFQKANNADAGVITLKDLKKIYNVKDHPRYLSGELTEKEILSEFLSNFDGNGGKLTTKISKDDFINYYSAVSASIDSDAYFDLVMRRAYKL